MAAAAADTLRNAEMRAWARDNGFTVSDAGRMPAGVQAAYEAAHAADDDGDGDGGPDWDAAAQALGVQPGTDPLADDAGADDLDGGAVSPGSTGDPAGTTARSNGRESTLNDGAAGQPVASLADARARMAAQGAQPKRPPWAGKAPAAGRAGGKGKGSTARGKSAPAPDIEVTPAVLDDMAGKLALLLAPALYTWSMLDDDDCADIAAEHAENIVGRLVPLMARSPAVVRFMTIDTGWFALVALAQAVQPLAVAVYKNHWTAEARAARTPQAKAQRQQEMQRARAQADLSDYVVNPVVRGHVPAYRPA